MSLWLHLHFPRFPLEVVSRGLPAVCGVGPGPVIVTEGSGTRAKVVAAAPDALALGLRPGMSLGAAWGLAAGLAVCQRDRESEVQTLGDIGAWAMQFSSLVVLRPPMGVSLEIGGSLSLFGGLDALLERLRVQTGALGFTVCIGVAPTPIAANLLAVVANFGEEEPPVLIATDLDHELGDVPIQALPLAVPELPARTVVALDKLGIKTLSDCEALPRNGLSRRVEGIVKVFDRIYGRAPDPQSPYEPPLEFSSKLSLPAPTTSVEALLFAVNRLYQLLAGFLLSRAAGVALVELSLQHEGARSDSVVEIRMIRPSRDPAHLMALTRNRLEQSTLGAEVHGLTLCARDISSLALCNQDLFLAPAAESAEQDVIELIERLESRLSEQEVHRLALCSDHRPEHAWTVAPMRISASPLVSAPNDTFSTGACSRGHRRPLWILAEPVLLETLFKGDPLEQLSIHSGPERIESGWWDDAGVARDYYVARNAAGETLWIFEDRKAPGRWYLQGRFG